jgi:hypothetical protein
VTWTTALTAFLDALAARLAADVALPVVSIIRSDEYALRRVPSVAWTVFSDRLSENTNPFRVQFDVHGTFDQVLRVEEHIRAMHGDTPQTIEGVLMLAQYDDARDHADAEPGVSHRSVDFEIEPARS